MCYNFRMKKILMFRSSCREVSEQREFRGVCSYAKTRGWDIIPIADSDNLPSVADAVDFWRPEGCIVANTAKPARYGRKALKGIPTVFLDLHPDEAPDRAVCVFHDSQATAYTAARELLNLRYANFAYVAWFKKTYWSELRLDGFRKALSINGLKARVFRPCPSERSSAAKLQKRLRAFLASCPKPCAVFAANDEIGAWTITAAETEGFSVPRDIAVIGVDDNESVCENVRPSLSSVVPDFEKGGFLAAKALDGLMKHGSADSGSLSFGPLCVVRRASTRTDAMKNGTLVKALEYIRSHACEGISVDDVAAEMAMSRRSAETYFRLHAGNTIRDEILSEKLEHVKILLRQGNVSHAAIAERCGWKSLAPLCRTFKKKTGVTLSAFRSRDAKSRP